MGNNFSDKADVLKIRGIMSKGYGQLAKIVMLDNDLTIEAKGIYGYFVSFTGGGTNYAFPSRDKIIHDLAISKDTYYKHFRLLTEQGYITVEQQQDGRFLKNIYVIETYPEKFINMPIEGSEALTRAIELIREAEDISAAGYGNVPKSVMTDINISLQAKALYAYLCVWTGQDLNATPSRDTVLYHIGIGHTSYNKYMKQLLDRNYVTKRNILVNGRFSGLAYHLNNKISLDYSPQAEFSDTAKPDTAKPDTAKPDTAKPDTNNTNIQTIPNTNKKNIYQNQSISETTDEREEAETIDGLTDTKDIVFEMAENECLPQSWLFDMARLETAVDAISGNSDSLVLTGDSLADAARRQLHELFKTCLCEMLDGNGEPTRVNGAVIPYSAVYKNLNFVLQTGFTESDEPYATLAGFPEHIISEFLKNSERSKIRNHKSYLKAIIWTGLTTAFIAEAAQINHDFGGKK